MKSLSFIAFFIPMWISAQDCKLKKSTDPYTKEIKLSTRFMPMAGASLSIDADSKEIDFIFSMDEKEKCFTDAATAVVIFAGTNKMKANFRNSGPMNCEGFFHIIFKNGVATPSLLQKLSTQKIASILFTGNNKTQTTITLTPEEQDKMMMMAECLIKEAKTLLK